ncbi:MAG: DUF58 domain-containing protein [Gemmatimonadota bacterium]
MSFTAHPLSIRIAAWIAGRDGVEHGDVLLDRRRVYIIPTRAGIVFGAAMLVLLIGSINYALQLGFILTFLVTSIALVAMYHTHRNLTRVQLRGHRVENVFAGDVATFEIVASNPTVVPRHALGFALLSPTRERLTSVAADIPAGSTRLVRLGLPAMVRGRLACPRIRIETRFPFGLWQAWAYYTPPLTAFVFPKPEDDAPPLPATAGGTGEGVGLSSTGDDFAGVRPYQPGDPQKMIAWRLAARSDDLSVKLFDAPSGGELILDIDELPARMSHEERLARLARWVLVADAARVMCGLKLRGRTVEPGVGAEHRERCLIALALA